MKPLPPHRCEDHTGVLLPPMRETSDAVEVIPGVWMPKGTVEEWSAALLMVARIGLEAE